MKPSEIITADTQGEDPAVVLQHISAAVKAKQGILLQKNDSVLFLLHLGKHEAELHLFSQDAPIKLAKSVSFFIKEIRNSDIDKVYGKEPNTQVVELLKRLGVKVEKSDKPEFSWMAKE